MSKDFDIKPSNGADEAENEEAMKSAEVDANVADGAKTESTEADATEAVETEAEETEVLSAWDIMAQDDISQVSIVTEPAVVASTDADTDSDADANATTNPDIDANAESNSDANSDANSIPTSGSSTSSDSSSTSDSDTDSESATSSESDSDSAADSGSGSDSDTDINIEVGAIEQATIEQELSDPMIDLRRYPSLALQNITVMHRGKGKQQDAILDQLSLEFFSRKSHSILVSNNEQRAALLGVISGLLSPQGGTVSFKSQPLVEITRHDWRGHFLGLMTQRFGLLSDKSASENLVYTMQSSGRNFLKTMPLVADDVLREVGFDLERKNMAVRELHAYERVLVQLAKALCCEPNIVLADEPTLQLGEDGSKQVLTQLFNVAKRRDCTVIVLTSEPEVAKQADIQYSL